MYNIGLTVGSKFTLSEALWSLYEESCHLLDTTNFAIAIYNKQTNILQFAPVLSEAKRINDFAIPLNPRGLTAYIITTKNTLIIQDLTKIDKAVIEISHVLPEKSICSWLGVPIPNLVQPVDYAQGAIIVWSDQTDQFTNRDLLLLSAIANQAAVPIRYLQIFGSLNHWAMRMAVINDVAHLLVSNTVNMGEILFQILEQVENQVDVEVSLILLMDATGEFVFQAALGANIVDIKPFHITKREGIIKEVVITGQPAIAKDSSENVNLFTELEQQLGISVQNMLCAPLAVREETIGMLQLLNKRNGEFTIQDKEIVQSIVPFAGVAIENVRLHEQVLAERNRVIEVSEQARKELARNLHDGPTQIVTSIMTRLNFCQQALEKEPALLAEEIVYLQQKASEAIHQMRTMMFELRPLVLEVDGLVAALEVFLERRQVEVRESKLILKLRSNKPDGKISRQSAKIEANIFAIVQEAVNNAIKYAQAKNIIVQLTEAPEALYIIIADDGKGFDLNEVFADYSQRISLGMLNIRERSELIGGELQIKSAPEMGTHIFVCVTEEGRKPKLSWGQLTKDLFLV